MALAALALVVFGAYDSYPFVATPKKVNVSRFASIFYVDIEIDVTFSNISSPLKGLIIRSVAMCFFLGVAIDPHAIIVGRLERT